MPDGDADLFGCWERPEGVCCRRAAKKEVRKKGRWDGIVGCGWLEDMGVEDAVRLGWSGEVRRLRDFPCDKESR